MTSERGELRTLGVVRALFGGLVLLRTTPALAPFHVSYLEGTRPLLGWPTNAWHVAAFGLALPAWLVASLCVARTVAAVLFTVGVRSSPAGAIVAISGWLVLAQDTLSYVNTLHLLYLGTLVLAASGAGSAFAWRREPAVDPGSGRTLTRAFVASVYAWSGLAKLNASWLSGDALARLLQSRVVSGVVAESLLASPPGRVAAAWCIAAIELALGPLLFWRRTRAAALIAALALHLGLEVSMHPDFFGFAMAALLLAFVGPRAVTGSLRATPPSPRATR